MVLTRSTNLFITIVRETIIVVLFDRSVRKLFSLTKKTKLPTRTESTVLISNMSSEGTNVFAEYTVKSKMDEVSKRKKAMEQ